MVKGTKKGLNGEFSDFEIYILTSEKFDFKYYEKPPEKIRSRKITASNNGTDYRGNVLSRYFLDIEEFGILSKEEQLILGREKDYYGWKAREAYNQLISTKNKEIRASLTQKVHYLIDNMMEPVNELFVHNLKFVIKVAKECNVNLSLEDKIQYGNIGLLKAIYRFNPERNYNIVTYARWWIIQGIMRSKESLTESKNNYLYFIKIPVDVPGKISKFHKWKDELISERGRQPTEQEIKKELKRLNLSENRYNAAMRAFNITSLDNKFRDGENERENIIDFSNNGNSYGYTNGENSDTLAKVLILKEVRKLPERERKIIKLIYGLDNGKPLTLGEVGKEFNLSRECIRQIKAKALEKLKRRPSIKSLHADLV